MGLMPPAHSDQRHGRRSPFRQATAGPPGSMPSAGEGAAEVGQGGGDGAVACIAGYCPVEGPGGVADSGFAWTRTFKPSAPNSATEPRTHVWRWLQPTTCGQCGPSHGILSGASQTQTVTTHQACLAGKPQHGRSFGLGPLWASGLACLLSLLLVPPPAPSAPPFHS